MVVHLGGEVDAHNAAAVAHRLQAAALGRRLAVLNVDLTAVGHVSLAGAQAFAEAARAARQAGVTLVVSYVSFRVAVTLRRAGLGDLLDDEA